jgi:hypothetical protein
MILGILQFDPSEAEAGSVSIPLAPPAVIPQRPAAAAGRDALDPVTIPLIPRAVAHLPTQRWRWSARRGMAQDHPFGRIARIEENLERLVGTLEAEVDRLIAETGQLLSDEHSD